MPSPSQLEQQLQADRLKRSSLTSKFNLQNSLSAGSQAPEPGGINGIDKLNQQVNVTAEGLKEKATVEILGMADTLGISGIGTDEPSVPDLCPDPAVIAQILERRNALISQLEVGALFINTIDRVLNAISGLINGTQDTLQVLNAIKVATAAATQFLPSVPGAITFAISAFDDVRTLLTFKSDGNPRLPELKRAVDTGATYTTRAALVINSILLALKSIDLFLEKCGGTLGETSGELNELIEKGQAVSTNAFETSYKGFTFQIAEEPFSPTVNRKIGQALNSEGIVLLQTDPSFTQDPQVLIEELKLIIDRDNLKAN